MPSMRTTPARADGVARGEAIIADRVGAVALGGMGQDKAGGGPRWVHSSVVSGGGGRA